MMAINDATGPQGLVRPLAGSVVVVVARDRSQLLRLIGLFLEGGRHVCICAAVIIRDRCSSPRRGGSGGRLKVTVECDERHRAQHQQQQVCIGEAWVEQQVPFACGASCCLPSGIPFCSFHKGSPVARSLIHVRMFSAHLAALLPHGAAFGRPTGLGWPGSRSPTRLMKGDDEMEQDKSGRHFANCWRSRCKGGGDEEEGFRGCGDGLSPWTPPGTREPSKRLTARPRRRRQRRVGNLCPARLNAERLSLIH